MNYPIIDGIFETYLFWSESWYRVILTCFRTLKTNFHHSITGMRSFSDYIYNPKEGSDNHLTTNLLLDLRDSSSGKSFRSSGATWGMWAEQLVIFVDYIHCNISLSFVFYWSFFVRREVSVFSSSVEQDYTTCLVQ